MVRIPNDFAGKRVYLRFEGVYSHCRIWINNRYIRTHIGGFTPFDCDLTPFSDQREVTLIVGVADIEGSEEGIWNPNQEQLGDSSWASFYAHHNVCGILRNVTLFALGSCFIGRTHFSARRTEDRTILDASVAVCVPKGTTADGLSLQLQLTDPDGHTQASFSGEVTEQFHTEPPVLPEPEMHPDEKWCQSHPESHANDERNSARFIPSFCNEYDSMELYSLQTSLPVTHPVLWDAEHPYLYTLSVSLLKNGKPLQRNDIQTGLRILGYGGMDGGDSNKLYVNGKEIKLRGVCHHDVSYRYGRSMSEEEELHEILTYKRCNINFIRTSHYPVSEHMLSLCDRYGIYVELENAACFKGANGVDIYCPPQDFVCSFAEMVEYSRNHPSVILWSLANESGFEASYAFRTEYDYIKEADPTRPVIFSYPDTVDSRPRPYDVFSMHYQDVSGSLGLPDIPKLHDEFAHVPCYNLSDLRQDNNVRCQWGESIRRGWKNIFDTDGALGCAIWAAVDDVFLLPEGIPIRHQCHSDGRTAGYGEWGAVLDIYQREKPEAYLTKKAFSPVLLDTEQSHLSENNLHLQLQNRFDHTDLNELHLRCISAENAVLYEGRFPESILPHLSGNADITLSDKSQRVLAEFYQGTLLVESEWIGTQAEPLPLPSCKPMALTFMEKTPEEAVYRSAYLSLRIDQQSGELLLYRSGTAERLICGWEPYQKGCARTKRSVQITHQPKGGQAQITETSTFEDGTAAVLKLTFTGTQVHTDCQFYPSSAAMSEIEKAGVAIRLAHPANAVSWKRSGLYTVYPPEHIGRLSGTAYAADPQKPAYGEKPENAWFKDTVDPFLFSDQENSARSVTRDFQTTRDHIHQYRVNLADNWNLTVYPEDPDHSAMVERRGQEDWLLITKGCRYPGTGWGNYCGEMLDDASWHTAFTLTLETGTICPVRC